MFTPNEIQLMILAAMLAALVLHMSHNKKLNAIGDAVDGMVGALKGQAPIPPTRLVSPPPGSTAALLLVAAFGCAGIACTFTASCSAADKQSEATELKADLDCLAPNISAAAQDLGNGIEQWLLAKVAGSIAPDVITSALKTQLAADPTALLHCAVANAFESAVGSTPATPAVVSESATPTIPSRGAVLRTVLVNVRGSISQGTIRTSSGGSL